MKLPKAVLLLSLLALSLGSCTVYEDGPYVSLTPRKERIANDWVAERVVKADGTDITGDFDDWTWTFTSDGEAKITSPVLGVPVTFGGNWNLVDNDKIFQLIIVYGIGNSINDYEILRLTSKEFWLLDEENTEFRLQEK
jgi:hypothetical protein